MRNITLLVLLFLAGTSVGQSTMRTAAKVRAKLAKGKAYPAIRIATGVLGKPGHPEFYALRAEGYNAIAEFAKAGQDARTAIRLLPDSLSGLFQLAVAEQGMGRLDSAEALFGEVVQRSPTVEAYYRRAQVRQLQGKLAAASQDIDQAMVLEGAANAASARLHRLRGELAAMAGDTALAREELDRAIQLAPNDPVNYNSRGYYVHAYRGDFKGAITDYDKAIKLNPNYSYAFNNRGWSWYKAGNTAKALKDIGRAKRKKSMNPYVYRNLGVIALESGDTTKACLLFREAVDKGFTALYGNEVEDLMAASCKQGAGGNPHAPMQAPAGTMDHRQNRQPVRTNAP
jgi:tetratricopeptide (TPR) repeat protein